MTNKDDNRLQAVVDMVDVAGQMKASTVVVAGGDRVEDLALVESARDHGIIDRIILVGDRTKIEQAVEQVGIEIHHDDIVHAADSYEAAAATVRIIKNGGVDICLKGNISTPILNRQMLQLAERPTVSTITLFDAAPVADGRLMIMTDPGFTTVCNFGRMCDLIRNAVDVAHAVMQIDKPKVAILSANEKQLPSLPSTSLGMELARRDFKDAVVCGPLSFDLATDPESVRTKGMPEGPNAEIVAGNADILVCPGIDSANILYKSLMSMNKYGQASVACITMGFGIPYIIISRADTMETRLASIALCSIYAQRTHQSEKAVTEPATAEKKYRVLTVNPGSTSLKLAVYENDNCLHSSNIACDITEPRDSDEHDRKTNELVEQICREVENWGLTELDAVSGRGGFLPCGPEGLEGGTYSVAEKHEDRVNVQQDIVDGVSKFARMFHASNFGIPVAAKLARRFNVPAYTVDPVVVDEFTESARISGYEGIVRRNVSHALSVKAASKQAARQIGREVEDVNFVVAHLGGGITIAAVKGGRIVDTSIALLGEGPFTPKRVGQLPMSDIIDLCYSGRFTKDELIVEMTTRGGLRSLLGEHRMEVIEKRIDEGDKKAAAVVDALVYKIAREIGAAFVAAGTDVEAIVLTGGLSKSKRIVRALRNKVGWLAPVVVFSESLEGHALAAGAVEVLSGKSQARHYSNP